MTTNPLRPLIPGLVIALLFCFSPWTGEARAARSGEMKNKAKLLTLQDAIKLALRANRTLRSAGYGLDGQQLSLTAAKSAFDVKFTPSTQAGFDEDDERVQAGVAIDKKLVYGPAGSLSPTIERTSDEYTGQIALSLAIPVLRGLGKETNLDFVRSSQFSVRNAERSLYLTKVNTVINTVSAVYSIIEQRELVKLYESQAVRLKGHAEAATIKERVGLASPIDVYRAEIRLNDARDSLTLAQEALRNAKDRLKTILALSLEESIDVAAPLENRPVRLDLDRAVEIAYDNRIELVQAEDRIEEARRKSRVAEANLLPQLDVVVDYERFGIDDEIGGTGALDEDRWSINLVSTTDWARTEEKATYRQSLIDIKTAQLNFQTQKNDVQREVREKLDSLSKLKRRVNIRLEQIDQAEGKLALAKVKFNHGLASNFNIIEAETELQQARVNLLSVRIQHIVGTYELRGVLGTLIEH